MIPALSRGGRRLDCCRNRPIWLMLSKLFKIFQGNLHETLPILRSEMGRHYEKYDQVAQASSGFYDFVLKYCTELFLTDCWTVTFPLDENSDDEELDDDKDLTGFVVACELFMIWMRAFTLELEHHLDFCLVDWTGAATGCWKSKSRSSFHLTVAVACVAWVW